MLQYFVIKTVNLPPQLIKASRKPPQQMQKSRNSKFQYFWQLICLTNIIILITVRQIKFRVSFGMSLCGKADGMV